MKAVQYSQAASKALRRHGNMQARILAAVRGYAANPLAHANNVTPLVGSPFKRMRVGDYRVIFAETDTAITVVKIGPRGDVYE